jgi:chromate transporter
MSRATLVDAIAIGQFTPGPVFSSVTFIGYQLNGIQGAVVATIAIFIPSFLFVALLNPLVKKMRNSLSISIFLDAVNVASVAIIVAICWQMGRDSILDWRTLLIAVTSIAVTFGYPKINSAFIVIYGAVAGYLLSFLG